MGGVFGEIRGGVFMTACSVATRGAHAGCPVALHCWWLQLQLLCCEKNHGSGVYLDQVLDKGWCSGDGWESVNAGSYLMVRTKGDRFEVVAKPCP